MSGNLLATAELDRNQIVDLIAVAENELNSNQAYSVDTTQQGALLFFEASTRTRIGFESAAWQLGIKTVAMYETKYNETMSGAESLADTIRTLNPLVNFYAVRHPNPTVFEQITPYTTHPVINCGTGHQEHPTQALIDAFSIWKHFGRLDNLDIAMLGALRYSRAARSLLALLENFEGITVTGVTEPDLQPLATEVDAFQAKGNRYITAINGNWAKQDIVYSAGFPPRTPGSEYSQSVRDKYKVTESMVDALNDAAIIMNPLPRIDEIDIEVDSRPQSYYFKQNELGLHMRKAVLKKYALKG